MIFSIQWSRGSGVADGVFTTAACCMGDSLDITSVCLHCGEGESKPLQRCGSLIFLEWQ